MELNPSVGIHAIDTGLLLRLGAAAVIGLLLGIDREYRGHPAGLRTHGIVCFSAALMTVSIIALYYQLDGSRMDPLRIFEGVGAFIGIIGAGLIVFSKGQVHNITTAAHLWLTAAIGIACGAGQWPVVVFACIISLIMLTVLRLFEQKAEHREHQKQRHGTEDS